MKSNQLRQLSRSVVVALTALTTAFHMPSASANSRTYTTNADFDSGTLFNLVHSTPNELQLSSVITPFSVMWIANGGEDTVSRIDTNTGRETARYRTGFGPSGANGYVNHLNNPWGGPAPSRTAVDASGNVYVANRHFDNKESTIVKILATGGIDRNGNGQIDTSSDLNNDGVITNPSAEIMVLSDTNGNGVVDPAEIQDERIVWSARVGPVNGVCRSLSIGPDGHIWVGLYNSQQYYKISSVTGAVLLGPISVSGNSPYGSLVDASGKLYGAGLGNNFLRMNTVPPHSPQVLYHSGNNYGIALGNNKVYLALRDVGAYPVAVFDPSTSAFSYFNIPNTNGTLGISVDGNGDIFLSAATFTVGGGYALGATKLRPDGSVIWTKPAQSGATGGDQRGAIVDSNGNVWTVNRVNNSVSKFRGSDGAALGVFPVGNHPYTYSDATGSAFLQSNPSGNWTVIHDTTCTGAANAVISWTATVPASGASLVVEVRAADTVAALAAKTFVPVSSGGTVPASVVGRYLEVKATLSGTLGATLTTPILYDLTVTTPNDTTPPVITCPANIVRNTDAGKCDAIVTFAATAKDNCLGAPTITYSHASGSAFPKGTTTVVATATDAVGNTSNCSFTVTVNDIEKPVIACPANITTNTSTGSCDAVVTFAATASDNCSGVTVSYSPASGSTFPKGTSTVVATATDASGNTSNCSFTVTVVDAEKPVITCPSNIIANTIPGACDAPVTFAATATDNCPGVSVSYSHASGSVFAKGTTTVTATATDAAGNSSSCTFTVTVVDAEKPVIACPANITVNTLAGTCEAPVSFTATATDNCPGVTVSYSHASGTSFAKGVTTVTATATDASGNTSTCTFTVTVNDVEKPVLTCPTDITVNTAAGACTAPVTFAATATDNCPGVTVTYSVASGSVFQKGATLVTATATDASGNSTSCTFTVNVKDSEAPTILCPPNIVVGTTLGLCSAPVGFSATAADNCGAVTVTYSIAPGSVFQKGITPVTATATDASGNSTSCTFTVTVKDTEAPKITCPVNIVVGTDLGLCSAVVSYAATATDNCGATISYSIAPGSVFQKGTTSVTATATDAAGNSTSCTFTVTVKDTEAPKIACPPNIVVGTDLGLCSAVVSYAATATDNCGATISYSIAPGSVFQKGTTSVTATATDAAGNKSSCTFTVTVNDTQAPVGTCVPTTNPNGNNSPGAKSNGNSGQNPDGFYQLLGSDNCDAASALTLFIKDSASNYVAGPFKSGDKVKVTQAPGVTPNTKPMAGVIIAHIQLKGDALLVVKDAAGNTSVAAACLVPPGPK